VYNATGGLYVRTLDELESRVIPGTEESASSPFFSPDGRSVAFSQGGQLKRIALNGGSPVVIAPVPTTSGSGFSGGSWAPDDTIWFADSEGIRRVPATGGTPVTVIPAPAGQQLNSPRLLPGGDTVLFTERSPGNASAGPRICVLTLSTGVRKLLIEGGFDACYLETGHLVYAVGNILMGVAFDVRRLSIVGGAVPVVRGVMRAPARTAAFSNYGIAADGTLVWVHSAVIESDTLWKLALSDRAGKLTPLALPAGPYDAPRASPDGKRVALTVADVKESYVAIYDLDGKTALRRLTFGGNNRHPVWSRDGQRVTFQSDREGDPALFWQRADGNGPAERLTKPEKDTAHVPASWSPQDENLLFTVIPASAPETLGALWTYTHASGTTAPFGNVEQSSQSPMFSPDGRWVVYYNGGRSGGSYVQPFPATGAQHQLPTAVGGPNALNPVWLPDGTALIFAPGAGQFASVSVTTQPTFAFGNPTLVPRSFPPMSPGAPRAYDILPDGRFIGLILPEQATATGGTVQLEIRIAERWAEELKRLVPVK
jgi:serine/threonine-protein kinase